MTVTEHAPRVAVVVHPLRIEAYAPFSDADLEPRAQGPLIAWTGAITPHQRGPWAGKRRDHPNTRTPLAGPGEALGWLIATTAEMGYRWPDPEGVTYV